MNYSYRNDLKIEFRAVPYVSLHVLEYRISPDQDLTYTKEVSLLWGLIKFSYKRKYNTSWRRAYRFRNYSGAHKHRENENYLPIIVWKRSDFDHYKMTYKTIGEFFEMIDYYDKKEKLEWRKERDEYVENSRIWE